MPRRSPCTQAHARRSQTNAATVGSVNWIGKRALQGHARLMVDGSEYISLLQLSGHASKDIDLSLSREVNRQGQRKLTIPTCTG